MWTGLLCLTFQWQAVVNTVINLQIPITSFVHTTSPHHCRLNYTDFCYSSTTSMSCLNPGFRFCSIFSTLWKSVGMRWYSEEYCAVILYRKWNGRFPLFTQRFATLAVLCFRTNWQYTSMVAPQFKAWCCGYHSWSPHSTTLWGPGPSHPCVQVGNIATSVLLVFAKHPCLSVMQSVHEAYHLHHLATASISQSCFTL